MLLSLIHIFNPAGTLYIADPANNRIVVKPATGSQTAIGPTLTVVLPSTFAQTPAPVQGLSLIHI